MTYIWTERFFRVLDSPLLDPQHLLVPEEVHRQWGGQAAEARFEWPYMEFHSFVSQYGLPRGEAVIAVQGKKVAVDLAWNHFLKSMQNADDSHVESYTADSMEQFKERLAREGSAIISDKGLFCPKCRHWSHSFRMVKGSGHWTTVYEHRDKGGCHIMHEVYRRKSESESWRSCEAWKDLDARASKLDRLRKALRKYANCPQLLPEECVPDIIDPFLYQ